MVDLETERKARDDRIDERNGLSHYDKVFNYCLSRLEDNPDLHGTDALQEVKLTYGWDQPSRAFYAGPWRIAKMADRKKRTGSSRKNPPKQIVQERLSQGRAPQPQERLEEPRERLQTPLDVLHVVQTAAGQLTVREEGSDVRVIWSCRMTRKDLKHVLPLIDTIMESSLYTERLKP